MRVFILAAFFFVPPFHSAWCQSLTAQQAYEFLQAERHRAAVVQGDAPSSPPDSLRKALKILEAGLSYFARPEITALAQTDKPLYFRKSDMLFDLAVVQSKLGETSAAVASLRQILAPEFDGVYAKWIGEEPAFALARQDSSIRPMLEKAATLDNVFNSKALSTPYRPNLSEDEKVAGLSKLWSEAKYNFAYFDHLPGLDWDRLYLDYLPQVRATASTLAYYRVLQRFYAQLKDGHTGLWVNGGPLADSTAFRPPLRCQLVEGRVFVSQVLQDSLRLTGLVPGLEVLRIDGLPVREYAEWFVQPYQSGSTPQNVDVATYTYGLLRGPKDKPVEVEFHAATGKTFRRLLARTGYSKLTPAKPADFKILPGNIAYLQLTEFESNAGLKRFEAAYDSIATTNALILDVRLNGGGDSDNGWNILAYLSDKPFKTGKYFSRKYSPVERARGQGVVLETIGESRWSANGKHVYTKPVVVLTSAMTFSAAEDFALAFDVMRRGKLIGEPTGGSTGQPLSFSLPGGIMARVCTKRDTYPDGTEWVGKGIQPNLLVKPTAADVFAGRDTVLEAALRYLNPTPASSSKPKNPR
jgi:C-terminal processing protease CtpA/Prc